MAISGPDLLDRRLSSGACRPWPMPFGPSRRDVKNRSWRFFCTAACNLPADPAGSPCIPTWGREQSPLAVRCQRAFYLAVPRHRGTGRAARWKAPRECVASAPGSCAAPMSSPASRSGPCSVGLSAFRSRRACTRADERTTRILPVRAAPSRPSPCVARWRCRRPSQRPVPVSDRWLTGAVPASPMAPICSSTCIARPRSRAAPMRGGRRRDAGSPSDTAHLSHGGRASPCRRLNAGVVKAW